MTGRLLRFERSTATSLHAATALRASRDQIQPELRDAIRSIIDAVQILVLIAPRGVFTLARLARQLVKARNHPSRSA